MEMSDRTGQRILIGAGSFADADAALRIVEHLPGDFRAGLGGVLVEEVGTLATCQIPHQRVVLVSGTTTLAPSLAQMQTLLRADARAFQESLARTANPTGAHWVFAQDKGELVGASLRAAQGWDVLVIGYRQVHKIPGKIIVLESTGQSSDAMAKTSNRLSHQLSADRIVYSVGAYVDMPTRMPHSDTLQFGSLEDALKAVARTNAQAVLVDLNHGPIHNPDDLARLLEVARCPLFVFGTSGMNTMLEHSTQIPPISDNMGRDGGS
jgi:hypothetical protein